MSNDRQVISYLSPADLVALLNATGIIAVHETGMSDGKPVIHAAVKVVNAKTGEQLPGGLPFSVVMFKGPNEAGYSNIAIGTIVPAAELKVALPRDYFNFCNQRFRFTRVFPVDEGSFVIQMDLVLKDATREYVKFSFGLWGALFSQMLFELMGRGRESLIAAAEAYAQVHTDFAAQIATTPEVSEAVPVPAEPEDAPGVMTLEADAIVPLDVAVAEIPEPATAEVPVEAPVEEPKIEAAKAEETAIDVPAETVAAEETKLEEPAAELVAEPVEVSEPVAEAKVEAEPELSIVAGPAVETAGAEKAAEQVEVKQAAELGDAQAKDVMPA